MEFDAEEEGWAKYEAVRDALGAFGGISFTLAELFAERRGDTEPPAISVTLAADAHHFSDEQILNAAGEFTDAEAVSASRLYQFSAVPLALVVVQFLLQEGAQIPPGILSAALYDALRHFRLPGKASPALTLEINEGVEGRNVIATIPVGTDPIVAERAIAAFRSIATQPGTYECTSDGNWRIIHRRKR